MALCCILDSSTSTCTELAATLLHGKYCPGAPGASLQFLSSIFFVGLFGGFFFLMNLPLKGFARKLVLPCVTFCESTPLTSLLGVAVYGLWASGWI